MQTFPHIFGPITIKNLTLPNRLGVSAMRTNLVKKDGMVEERFILYHGEKVKGGGGLVGAETAEFLSFHGHQVIVLEALDQIMRDGEASTRYFLLQNFQKYGVQVHQAPLCRKYRKLPLFTGKRISCIP